MKTRIILAAVLTLAIFVFSWAKPDVITKREFPPEISEWEALAEQGDTTALHKLLRYYDENAVVYLEVEKVLSPEGEDITEEVKKENIADEEFSNLCNERLDYWLQKGLAINDPVAFKIKSLRDYYGDEAASIENLAKAADAGDSEAALFCGSACFNQGNYADAVKYLTMAYESGVPSAGWHLAMCYTSGRGVEKDNMKAVAYMRHATMMDYPEAVLEMKRIEPNNPIWEHKVDSLEIDFPDFPIITE